MRKKVHLLVFVAVLSGIADLGHMHPPEYATLPGQLPPILSGFADPTPSFPSLCGPGTNVGVFLLGVIGVLAVFITPDSGQKRQDDTLCLSVSLPQTKDPRGMVEMLLMMAGDVEPGPPVDLNNAPGSVYRPPEEPAGSKPGYILTLPDMDFVAIVTGKLNAQQDPRGLVELLLMIAGDVEPNPGPTLMVWIKMMKTGRLSTRVKVENDALIDDVIEAGLQKVNLSADVSSDMVKVKFNDDWVNRDAFANVFCTTASNPLLLHIIESEEPPAKRFKLYHEFPAPSDTSLTSEQSQLIKDHRAGKHGFHVSLMWKGFATFITQMQAKTVIATEWYVSARKLMMLMSNRYPNELDRKRKIQEFFKFGDGNESLSEYKLRDGGGQHGARCDLAWVENHHVYCSLECKNEFGRDAVAQNNLYFVHAHCQGEGLSPMLLISGVGAHYYQVFGAVFGHYHEVLVDPLCDPMSLLDVRDNPLDGESKVARFLSTLSGILPQLKQYYHNYDAAVNNCVPYYKQEDLQYTNPIGLRVWKARHKDCTVAMKFTRTYGQIVHHFLANEGMAPKLMSINELEGGWKVIEMEFVEGETLQECLNDLSDRQKKCIQERLKSVLSTMNTQQFVHGDLRLPNIMIRKEELTHESPTPIIVDFDWAGTQGQATYPSSLNAKLGWPFDVTEGAVIKHEHDNAMVSRLFPSM